MTTNLAALIAQKEALERQIREAQTAERAAAIAQIRDLMAQHGLTTDDLNSKVTGRVKAAGADRAKVAPKYRDEQGNSWTGRGLKPRWLADALAKGKKLEDFAI